MEILTLIFENSSITVVNSVVVSPQVVEKLPIVVVILKHYLYEHTAHDSSLDVM